jgi:hypothetical protein
VLTVAELLTELQLMPPESHVEVWYPAGCPATLRSDVDVALQAVHDNDQNPVALAVIANRPVCADPDCRARADLELTDRTGQRHPLCAQHASAVWWCDTALRVTGVFGGPGAPGWTTAAILLKARWAAEPAITAWAAHPARWTVPLPAQPERS